MVEAPPYGSSLLIKSNYIYVKLVRTGDMSSLGSFATSVSFWKLYMLVHKLTSGVSSAGVTWLSRRWNLTDNKPIQQNMALCNMYCEKCQSSKDQLMDFWRRSVLMLDLHFIAWKIDKSWAGQLGPIINNLKLGLVLAFGLNSDKLGHSWPNIKQTTFGMSLGQ